MKIREVLKERTFRKPKISFMNKIELKDINNKLEQIEQYGDQFSGFNKKTLLKRKKALIK